MERGMMQDEKLDIENAESEGNLHGQAELDRATRPEAEAIAKDETQETSDAQETTAAEMPTDAESQPLVETDTDDEEDGDKPASQAQSAADEDDENEDEADEEPAEELDEIEATLETVVESVLFASDEPLTPKRLVDIAEAGSVKRIRQCVKTLNKKYRDGGFSFRIEKISGGTR